MNAPGPGLRAPLKHTAEQERTVGLLQFRGQGLADWLILETPPRYRVVHRCAEAQTIYSSVTVQRDNDCLSCQCFSCQSHPSRR
jgi:hypothetical protein